MYFQIQNTKYNNILFKAGATEKLSFQKLLHKYLLLMLTEVFQNHSFENNNLDIFIVL